MKRIILYFFLLFSIKGFSQIKKGSALDKMQGIWSLTNKTENKNTHAVQVIKGHDCIYLIYSNPVDNPDNVAIYDMMIGFQDSITPAKDPGHNFNSKLLQDDGQFYTQVSRVFIDKDNMFSSSSANILKSFECDGNKLFYPIEAQMQEYHKTPQLSYDAIKALHYIGKRYNKNFLKDFVNIKVAVVKTAGCTVYKSPNQPDKIHLPQWDVPIVLEEKDGWLKIESYTDTGRTKITGWIKKSDTVE